MSLVSFVSLLVLSHPCRNASFEGDQFTVCNFDPQKQTLTIVEADSGGKPLRSFDAVETKCPVSFAMNAGMFDATGLPIGLLVRDSEVVHALNTNDGDGNFYMKPNGVFWIDAAGAPRVSTTAAFEGKARWATQSGPVLVIGGELHAKIARDGSSRYVRNGVGVDARGHAHFVISTTPVSFGKLARLFRDDLECPNALYFDGVVSSLWAPSLARKDTHAQLGPMVVVFDKDCAAPL